MSLNKIKLIVIVFTVATLLENSHFSEIRYSLAVDERSIQLRLN